VLKTTEVFGRNGSLHNGSIQVLRKVTFKKILLTIFSVEGTLKCEEEFLEGHVTKRVP
jgi:hypothetical protein